MCFVVTCWERADLLASFVVCHFPIGILGQVWYLIVSIPDLCILTYFARIINLKKQYKTIGYNINVLQQTACLVVNPIIVANLALLFICMLMGRTSDSMTVPT